MAISEQQLETWSHQGSVAQSSNTYNSIKAVLEAGEAPYAHRHFEVYLQGSYGNHTNVYAESDIDIVICLMGVWYRDISNLSPEEQAVYNADHWPAQYGFHHFKNDVLIWLRENFGAGVCQGKKAIFIPGNGGRREADVLACVEHRRYVSYRPNGIQYYTGICFWATDGRVFINFPKQHKENCKGKHQNTQEQFKPSVRILKNMRKAMADEGYLPDGVAPSYFLEGMLYNVPDQYFGVQYQPTIENCLRWLEQCDSEKLVCANCLHWLIRDSQVECWNLGDFQLFLDSARRYWDNGGR